MMSDTGFGEEERMATALTIEALGITKKEAAERVIQKIADQVLYDEHYDEDGNPFRGESAFRLSVEKAIRSRIDEEVKRLGDSEIEPRIASLVDGVTLQQTNQWGEAKGTAVTFREYLVQRAEAYMTEQVDYEGKPKGTSSFSWTGRSTRVAYMVDKHLHFEIERAMKEALGNLNSTVAKGLHEATRVALNGVLAGLKVEVKTK
jgi:hypothetical protein